MEIKNQINKFNMITNNNFNDLYKTIIQETMHGRSVKPRGIQTYELSPGIFELTDITKSLLTLKERKLSYKFNAVEKLCYITGNSGEDILPKFAPNIARFINPNTKKFDGSYGPRLFKQFSYILTLLKKDPDTRQAIFTINNYHEDLHESLDIPCTCTIQFLIRDNKLNAITYMRSNDLLWGTPYDVSQFTFIQECFARILNINPGTYTHVVGSMHIYAKDVDIFKKILNSNEVNNQKQLNVDISSFQQLIDQATSVLKSDKYDNQFEFNDKLTNYFKNLYEIIHGK